MTHQWNVAEKEPIKYILLLEDVIDWLQAIEQWDVFSDKWDSTKISSYSFSNRFEWRQIVFGTSRVHSPMVQLIWIVLLIQKCFAIFCDQNRQKEFVRRISDWEISILVYNISSISKLPVWRGKKPGNSMKHYELYEQCIYHLSGWIILIIIDHMHSFIGWFISKYFVTDIPLFLVLRKSNAADVIIKSFMPGRTINFNDLYVSRQHNDISSDSLPPNVVPGTSKGLFCWWYHWVESWMNERFFVMFQNHNTCQELGLI